MNADDPDVIVRVVERAASLRCTITRPPGHEDETCDTDETRDVDLWCSGCVARWFALRVLEFVELEEKRRSANSTSASGGAE